MINLLNVGVQGLKAHQEALSATSQNITNVNNPGYSRQVADFSAHTSSAGLQMVSVDSITRQVDQFIQQQVWSDTASYNRAVAFNDNASQLDAYLSNDSASLDTALTSFFGAMQSAVEDPSSLPIRQLVLSETDAFINRVQNLAGRLQTQQNTLNAQMSSQVNQISTLGANIAEMNAKIASQSGMGNQPNELLDRRDELIRELSAMVDVQVIQQDASSVNVLVGRGIPLVVGTDSNKMSLVKTDPDTGQQGVAVVIGNEPREVTEDINGGALGGLLAYREEVLTPAMQEVDRLAMVVSDEMNRQHRMGMDLDGNLGQDLFTDINQGYTQSYSMESFPAATVPTVEIDRDPAQDDPKLTLRSSGYRIQINSVDTPNNQFDYQIFRTDGSEVTSGATTATFDDAGKQLTFDGLRVNLDLSGEATLNDIDGAQFVIDTQAPTSSRIVPSANNSDASRTANAWVEVTETAKLQASDYRLDFVTPTDVTVTRLSDGAVSNFTYDPANDRSIEVDGLSIVMDTPAGGSAPINFASGDSFLIRPTLNGASGMQLEISGERELAFASPIKATANENNTGLAEVASLVVTDPTTSTFASASKAMSPPVEIVFTSPTTYNLLDISDAGAPRLLGTANQAYTPGGVIELDGYEIQLSGQPAIGDRFRIEHNSATVNGAVKYGVADNTNAFSMVDLQSNAGIVSGGGAITYNESYGHLLETVGSRSRVAQIDEDASKAVLGQTMERRDSVSGVNLDEEAANLIKFEQAYNASAQVIAVARSLFQTMLQTFS